ncbi:MAG: hypothetical protein R3Y09_12240 [Clostridia bacterium]
MNLPKKTVENVIIGEKYYRILKEPLSSRGIKCITIPKNKSVEWQLNSHADIQIIHIKDNIFVCEPSINVDFDVIYGETMLKKGYPNNISYNGLLIGNHFFHKLDSTDCKILEKLEDINLHNVKQGFSKCSTLVLGEKLAITADKGMFKALKDAQIETLLIDEGYVDLQGYDYGFIGGSGFLSDENTVCFTGRLDHHPSYDKIVEFITMNNIQIDYLTNEKIFDVGSILPIFF